jgi:hypothetical protein
MTPAQIQKLRRQFPNAPESFFQRQIDEPEIRTDISTENSRQVAVMESNSGDAPLETKKVQRQVGARFLARFTSTRKRLIDESNLCYKYHEDLCRYAGALPDDSPEICHSEVWQRKILKGEIEEVIIEIFNDEN